MAGMTASDVLDSIWDRWPDEQWVKVTEAPDSSDRMGRKIDLLCLNAWRSKGYAVECVEVKVSAADCRKEFADPAKSEFWFRHSNRFWLALPSDIYKLVKEEVPDTWGVITISDNGKARAVRQAPKRDRVDLAHGTYLGLLRSSRADLIDATRRARSAGREEGRKAAEATAERLESGRTQHLERQLNELRNNVQQFKDACGIDLAGFRAGVALGEAVNEVRRLEAQPDLTDKLHEIGDAYIDAAIAIQTLRDQQEAQT